MQRLRQWWPHPGTRTRLVAGLLTVLVLMPLLQHLPQVSVVACFDSGHPLYRWIPSSDLTGVHCITAPAPAVSWTLMVGATLIVQSILLPALLLTGAMLLHAVRRLAAIADRVLAAALVQLHVILVADRQLVAVPVRTRATGTIRARENPRRGPPICL